MPLSQTIVSYRPRARGVGIGCEAAPVMVQRGVRWGDNKTHVSGQMDPDRFGTRPRGNVSFGWEAPGRLLVIK